MVSVLVGKWLFLSYCPWFVIFLRDLITSCRNYLHLGIIYFLKCVFCLFVTFCTIIRSFHFIRKDLLLFLWLLCLSPTRRRHVVFRLVIVFLPPLFLKRRRVESWHIQMIFGTNNQSNKSCSTLNARPWTASPYRVTAPFMKNLVIT